MKSTCSSRFSRTLHGPGCCSRPWPPLKRVPNVAGRTEESWRWTWGHGASRWSSSYAFREYFYSIGSFLNMIKYLDLHLALFSAHSSFHLDLRSFWLFMLTWTRKRAFVSWRTGIYAYFPAKYAHIFGFKMHQVQKCQKWCNYAHVEKNRSKSRNLANEHLFVFFRGYRYVYACCVHANLVYQVLYVTCT